MARDLPKLTGGRLGRMLATRRKEGSRYRVRVWVRTYAPPMQRVARIGTDEAPGLGTDAIVSRRADHA